MKPTNGAIYGSKDRPKFKIWDNEKNEWYKPTYEAYNGKVEDLSLSPSGELSMRKINEFAHESVFPYRFEVVMEVPKVVVPKFAAEWIELCKEKANLVDCLNGGYRHFNGCESIGKDEDWLFEGDNQDVVARAWLDGYEVEKEPFSWAVKGITDYFKYGGKIIVFKNEEEALEVANLIGINTEVEKMNNIDCQDCISIEELRSEKKEQLYYVALPKLDDSDFRYLWTDVDGTVYTQARKGLCIGKLKHTESEIKAIDERYWPFAVPVGESDE